MSKVAVVMGSTSDLPVMQEAIDILKGFDIEVDVEHPKSCSISVKMPIPMDIR